MHEFAQDGGAARLELLARYSSSWSSVEPTMLCMLWNGTTVAPERFNLNVGGPTAIGVLMTCTPPAVLSSP